MSCVFRVALERCFFYYKDCVTRGECKCAYIRFCSADVVLEGNSLESNGAGFRSCDTSLQVFIVRKLAIFDVDTDARRRHHTVPSGGGELVVRYHYIYDVTVNIPS
jgi:hypothetical protein